MYLKNKKNIFWAFISFLTLFFVLTLGLYIWVEVDRNRFCFYAHLDDAIKVNKQRAKYYSSLTGGKSEKVSKALIKKEFLTKPIAIIMDLNSRNLLNDNNKPLICDAFVSMDDIRVKEERLENYSIANTELISGLKMEMENFKNKIIAYNDNNNFIEIEKASRKFLLEIKILEEETGSNFCMTKHVVESLGITAKQANIFSTNNKFNNFYNKFVNVQVGALSDFPINLDRDAHLSHNLGVGIICNDVPEILF